MLFQRDLFATAAPDFSELTSEEARAVHEAFRRSFAHLGEVQAVRRCGASHINSRNFLVRATGGSFVLKESSAEGIAATNAQLDLAEWLSRRGLPLPMPRRTESGGWAAIDGPRAYTVLDFVEGNYFQGGDAELSSVGAVIAALDESLRAAPPTARGSLPSYAFDTAAAAVVLAELHERRASWNSIFGDETANHVREGWKAIAAALEESTQYRRRPASVVHIDLHPHNVLVRDQAVCGVLDFASFAHGDPQVFIGFAAFKLLRQSVALRLSTVDAARGFLAPLLRAVGPSASYAELGCAARIEITRRVFIVLDCNVSKGDRRWNAVLPVHLAALEESRMLFGIT